MPGQHANQSEKIVPVQNGHSGELTAGEFTPEFKHLPIGHRTMIGLARIECTCQPAATVSHNFKSDDDLIFFPARFKVRWQHNIEFQPEPIRCSLYHTAAGTNSSV